MVANTVLHPQLRISAVGLKLLLDLLEVLCYRIHGLGFSSLISLFFKLSGSLLQMRTLYNNAFSITMTAGSAPALQGRGEILDHLWVVLDLGNYGNGFPGPWITALFQFNFHSVCSEIHEYAIAIIVRVKEPEDQKKLSCASEKCSIWRASEPEIYSARKRSAAATAPRMGPTTGTQA